MRPNTLIASALAATLSGLLSLTIAGCDKVQAHYADNKLVVQANLPTPQDEQDVQDYQDTQEYQANQVAEVTQLASEGSIQPEPISAYGNPSYYHINGKLYTVMADAASYDKVGIASWYGKDFDGKLTANQEIYDMNKLTAASKTLPLPSYVRVTNLSNNKSVIVRVNDRGPYVDGRIMDLSYAAAKALDFTNEGTAKVHIVALSTPHLASGSHYLQVASFSKKKNAEKYKEKIAKLTDEQVRIRHYVKNNHEQYYRIEVGPYLSSDKLHTAQREFKKEGFEHTIAIIG